MSSAEFASVGITDIRANLENTYLLIEAGLPESDEITFDANHAGIEAVQAGEVLNIQDIDLANRHLANIGGNSGASYYGAIGAGATVTVGAMGDGARGFLSPNSDKEATLTIPGSAAYNYYLNSEQELVFEQDDDYKFKVDKILKISSSAGSVAISGSGFSFENLSYSIRRRGNGVMITGLATNSPIKFESENFDLSVVNLQTPSYELGGESDRIKVITR